MQLNSLCIDPVVLFVGANKPDIDYLGGIIDPDDKSILVSCNIEHYPPAFQNAGVPEVPLHLSGGVPVNMTAIVVPG